MAHAAADTYGTRFAFAAPVNALVFARETPVFACGDGTIRRIVAPSRALAAEAHEGAALALAAWGADVLSGGDDGRLVRTGADGARKELARFPRRWIEHVAAHEGAGLIAASAGKEAHLIGRDGAPVASFAHRSSVGGLAFAPLKGKRLAVSHYGGVSLWWANASAQSPKLLPWKGAHAQVTWSRDERFVVSAMQENALHGWRLADMADLRMSGYPHKVKSMSWGAKGKVLATSGASAVICWPFAAKDGPMGKAPLELGPDGDGAIVTAVAAHPREDAVAAGYADGGVRLHRMAPPGLPALIETAGGSPVTALAWSDDGLRLAYGRSDGTAALIVLPEA